MTSHCGWRRRLRGACAAGAFLVAMIALSLLADEARRHTPDLAAERSIAVMERASLNGSLQEVWIRGEDTRNPVLVLLHGGPGTSESALFRHFVPEIERYFTVVYWDQRGTGRSWLPAAHREAISTEQLLLDLDALISSVTERLHKRQVILLGHSWGTVLGVLYAQRHPERVKHYVGVAQLVNTVLGQRLEQEFIRAQADAHSDAVALDELGNLPRPPLSVDAMLRQGELCESAGGVFHGAMRTPDLIWAALTEPETSMLDLALFGLGNRFSLDRLWSDLVVVDFFSQVDALKVPVTLFLGRHDHHVPSELASRWLAQLKAPAKRLVWFESSAHNPPFEEPVRFVSELARLVAP